MLLALAIAGCSVERGEALGRAPLALAPGFFIGNVLVEPATYHTNSPANLLASAEGAGPRTLNVAVSTSVSPEVSYTGTRTPSHEDISKALGFSLTQTYLLSADSAVLIPVNAYARVEAYPAFQRVTWQVLGPDATVWGSGTAMKPVGIFFDTTGCIGLDPCSTWLPGPPFDYPPDAGP
jgi:hypothetical protein